MRSSLTGSSAQRRGRADGERLEDVARQFMDIGLRAALAIRRVGNATIVPSRSSRPVRALRQIDRTGGAITQREGSVFLIGSTT